MSRLRNLLIIINLLVKVLLLLAKLDGLWLKHSVSSDDLILDHYVFLQLRRVPVADQLKFMVFRLLSCY